MSESLVQGWFFYLVESNESTFDLYFHIRKEPVFCVCVFSVLVTK